jgi:serine/threonine protein kinase
MSSQVTVVCKSCAARLRIAVPEGEALVRCPRCGTTLRIRPPGKDSTVGKSAVGTGAGGGSGAVPVANASKPDSEPSTVRVRASTGSTSGVAVRRGESSSGQTDPMIGKTLGQYRLLSKLGRGGKGVVYEAEDTRIGRRVALKVMAPEVIAAAESLQRFMREAKAAAKIEHPNVVTIYSVDEQNGTVFIAMSLVRGGSVQDKLSASGAMDAFEATRIVKSAARGLHSVHAAGIVHRDIKPANIMLGENGEVKIADFGTAKIIDDSVAQLTEPGMLIGTPQYMSPEQCMGQKVDPRSDIYSLGVTYFRLLTGKAPFADMNPLAIARKHISEPHPDPRSINSSVPDMCVRIINKAMAKDRENRFKTAGEMADSLEPVEISLRQQRDLHEEAGAAPPAGGGRPGRMDENTLLEMLSAEDDPSSDEIRPVDPSRAEEDRSPPPFRAPTGLPASTGRSRMSLPAVGTGASGAVKPPIPPAARPKVNLEGGSGSGLFDAGELNSAVKEDALAGPVRDGSRSGAVNVQKAGEAEREFVETNKSGMRVSVERLTLPFTANYTWQFSGLDDAKAALNTLRKDVRSILRKKVISPSISKGQRVALLEFQARLPADEHLLLAKSLRWAKGEFLTVVSEERDLTDYLKRQIMLIRSH